MGGARGPGAIHFGAVRAQPEGHVTDAGHVAPRINADGAFTVVMAGSSGDNQKVRP